MSNICEKLSKLALLSSNHVMKYDFVSEGKKEGTEMEEGTLVYNNPYIKIGKTIKLKDWLFYIESSLSGSFICASDGKTIRYNFGLMTNGGDDEFLSFINEKILPLFD